MNLPFLEPEEHVLSTLERDGSRRWLKPKLNPGTWWTRRRVVAYALIIIFTVAPFIHWGNKPLVLLDIPARRFTIFFYTFLPTDTVLLALFLVGTLLSIFLITAMFGRIWCGWACPQTVYMEFLIRPIERLFEGTVGKGGEPKKNRPGWIRALKYPVYFLACFYLANTFLAYFVGVETLWTWMKQSPLEHPTPFFIMAFVTLAMMLDFVYFREQVCIIMCPYGRFQSVLLDQSSLIVSYDQQRGEPRGRVQKGAAALPVIGDCVDCGRCVTTCPTGIDIRKGLQMECINCTQCIDACNDVMAKLGRAPDLIRYSSQARDQGRSSRLARPRLFIYPTILLGIATLFLTILWNKQPFNAYLLRERGNPFTVIGDNRDQVRNVIRLKITNRTDAPMSFELAAVQPPQTTVTAKEERLVVPRQAEKIFHLDVVAPLAEFGPSGQRELQLRVTNQAGVSSDEWFSLQGPERRNVSAANTGAAPEPALTPTNPSAAESSEPATAASL